MIGGKPSGVGLRRGLRAAIVLLSLSVAVLSRSQAQASVVVTRACAEAPLVVVARLPLAVRCELARLVADEISRVVLLSQGAAPASLEERDGAEPLRLFLSRERRGVWESATSVFRVGEDCGERLAVGGGGRDDLPEGQTFRRAWIRTLAPGRWQIEWRFGDSIWSCPKPVGHLPQVCTYPIVSPVPLPTLKVVVNQMGPHDVPQIESSALEFINAEQTGAVPVGAGSDVAVLPLAERCELARQIAWQIVNVAAFNRRAAGWIDVEPTRVDWRGLDLFVARADNDRASVFRDGESCASERIPAMYAPDVRFVPAFATGSWDRLAHADTYQVVRAETAGADRWRFRWQYTHRLWACPTTVERTPRACAAPPDIEGAPTLEIVIGRDGPDAFRRLSSILRLR